MTRVSCSLVCMCGACVRACVPAYVRARVNVPRSYAAKPLKRGELVLSVPRSRNISVATAEQSPLVVLFAKEYAI